MTVAIPTGNRAFVSFTSVDGRRYRFATPPELDAVSRLALCNAVAIGEQGRGGDPAEVQRAFNVVLADMDGQPFLPAPRRDVMEAPAAPVAAVSAAPQRGAAEPRTEKGTLPPTRTGPGPSLPSPEGTSADQMTPVGVMTRAPLAHRVGSPE